MLDEQKAASEKAKQQATPKPKPTPAPAPAPPPPPPKKTEYKPAEEPPKPVK